MRLIKLFFILFSSIRLYWYKTIIIISLIDKIVNTICRINNKKSPDMELF